MFSSTKSRLELIRDMDLTNDIESRLKAAEDNIVGLVYYREKYTYGNLIPVEGHPFPQYSERERLPLNPPKDILITRDMIGWDKGSVLDAKLEGWDEDVLGYYMNMPIDIKFLFDRRMFYIEGACHVHRKGRGGLYVLSEETELNPNRDGEWIDRWNGPWDSLKEWYMNESAEAFAKDANIDGIPIRQVLEHSLIISLM